MRRTINLLGIIIARIAVVLIGIAVNLARGTATGSATEILHQQTVQVVPNLWVLHHILHLGTDVGHVSIRHYLAKSRQAVGELNRGSVLSTQFY